MIIKMTDNSNKIEWKEEIMTNWSFVDKIVAYFLNSSDKSTFSWKDKILFYKELVYMMKGGVSLMETMQTIQKTSDNAAVKGVAKEISGY